MHAPFALTPGLVGLDRHLGAVARFPRDRCDLDRAVGDLGNLELEELAHQVGMGARQGDRRAAVPPADLHDIGPQPLTVGVGLGGYLLLRRQDRLDPSQVDQHVARVLALLDDTGDDLGLPPGELAQGDLVLGVPQPLQDDLLRRGRGDPPEPGGWRRIPGSAAPLRRALRPTP